MSEVHTTETRLIEWNNIKAQIVSAKDIVLLGKLNYSLEAIQKWAKQSKQGLETQNEIAEYRLHLNRKQGEWIEVNIPEEGAKGIGPAIATKNSYISLADVGIDKNDSPKFRKLARIPEPKFDEIIKEKKFQKEELATKEVIAAYFDKPHVARNTGENEWYTPAMYLNAARRTMGSIDCDPASSDKANELVRAKTYFTKENDGRKQAWYGNLWLNPPYNQPLVSDFCELLVKKYKEKEIQQACVLVNNATETNFYQNMLRICSAVCFIKGRVKFVA